MESTDERRRALISQIQQLRRELDNLKRQDRRQSPLRTGADHSGCAGLDEFDSKLQN